MSLLTGLPLGLVYGGFTGRRDLVRPAKMFARMAGPLEQRLCGRRIPVPRVGKVRNWNLVEGVRGARLGLPDVG